MHHGFEGLLLTAIGGYWVLERSAGQKGQVKRVGQLLGGFIIVASLVGILCHVWYLSGGSGYCPMPKGDSGWRCPYSPKAPLMSQPASPGTAKKTR